MHSPRMRFVNCNMKYGIAFITLIVLSLSTLDSLSAQLYFQFEEAFTTDVRKYQVGDIIEFRTKQFQGWQQGSISQILPEDNALLFEDRITHLEDFTHFKYTRPAAVAVGTTLELFGASWLLIGGAIEGLRGVGAIETQYEFGWDTAIIGVTSMATGFLTRKLWGKAVKKMNDRNRVRIIDLRL